MLSQNHTETAAPDNDGVEWPCVRLRAAVGPLSVLVGAAYGFVEAVAHVAAEDVLCEICHLRSGAGHDTLPRRYNVSGKILQRVIAINTPSDGCGRTRQPKSVSSILMVRDHGSGPVRPPGL